MNNNELYHYGVLGMKWGRRKAKQEYRSNKPPRKNWKYHKERLNEYNREFETKGDRILMRTSNQYKANKELNSLVTGLNKKYKDSIDYKIKRDKRIKAAKIIGGTAAIATGVYAVNKYLKKKGIKFESSATIKAREQIAESKRLNDLMAESTKNLDSFFDEMMKIQLQKR